MTELMQQWSEALSLAPQGPAPDWLRDLRESAAGQFRAAGLPHRKVEAWKYTPIKVLDGLSLTPPDQAAAPASDFSPSLCRDAATIDIRDGVLGAVPRDLPGGLELLTLAEGLERFEGRLRPLFEAVELQGATRAFAALNTALAQQGLVVRVAKDEAGSGQPARLLLRWGFAEGAASLMSHFRLFILLDDGASLELVEHFAGTSGECGKAGGLNVLCQAELGAGAALDHTRVQTAPDEAVLLATATASQARDSRYRYRGFDLGGALARLEFTARLTGSGADADLAGAWLLDGRRHVDNHICVEHLAPGCSSEQFFRGVLDGRSRGVFNGRALIQTGADGSSVRQSNANLLLSPLAEMDTKPELEIYADEVEASHGATVGQLDDTAVFYLRSRGLSEDAARRMLTSAFCRAVTDRVADRDLAGRIEELLEAAMPGSDP